MIGVFIPLGDEGSQLKTGPLRECECAVEGRRFAGWSSQKIEGNSEAKLRPDLEFRKEPWAVGNELDTADRHIQLPGAREKRDGVSQAFFIGLKGGLHAFWGVPMKARFLSPPNSSCQGG